MTPFKKIMLFASLMLVLSAVAGIRLWEDRIHLEPAQTVLAEDDGDGETTDAQEGDGEDSPCPECPECPDPAQVVLRGLEEKRASVEQQMSDLAQEKKELERYEEQLDEKLNALTAMQNQIKTDLALLDRKKTQAEQDQEAAYEAKLARLVKMYAGMKPKDAAAIVNQMSMETAQEIFNRMREASASQILSFVDSEKAAKISERLAFKRK